ncbi:MAG: hypothetical protein M3394_01690 [Actinomycetota bacterium]|nr:hypothetical protein [Actinomycetota bacterium]
MHQGLQQCLALRVAACVDGLLDACPKLGQDFPARRYRDFRVQRFGQLLASGAQLGEFAAQLAYPSPALGFGHGVVLEGAQVLVECYGRLVDPRLDRGQLGGAQVAVFVRVGGHRGQRLVEQVVSAVGGEERLQHGVVQSVGGKTVGVAAVRALPLARPTGVVAVAGRTAVSHGARVLVAAPGASHQPGQQVVAGVAGAAGVVLAAFEEESLRLLEQVDVHQRGMGGDVPVVAEEHLADVGPVVQDAQDRHVAPQAAVAGPVPVVVEPAGDGVGAHALADVEVEDHRHQWRPRLVDHEVVGAVVALAPLGHGVAERVAAGDPLALGCLALHGRDHPVDDRLALELGEHAEKLHEHPTGGRGRVDGLGGRPEGDAAAVKLLQQVDQHRQLPCEAVDPVDEQHVVEAEGGVAQRTLQRGALDLGAAHLVDVGLAGKRPAGLGLDEGPQAVVLAFEGEGLVLLVGGDAEVDRHPDLAAGSVAVAARGVQPCRLARVTHRFVPPRRRPLAPVVLLGSGRRSVSRAHFSMSGQFHAG